MNLYILVLLDLGEVDCDDCVSADNWRFGADKCD